MEVIRRARRIQRLKITLIHFPLRKEPTRDHLKQINPDSTV